MTIDQIDKQVNEKLKGTKFVCVNGRILIDPSQEPEEPTLNKRGKDWDVWVGSFPGGNIDPGIGYPSGSLCDPNTTIPCTTRSIRGDAQYISDPKNKPIMSELRSDKSVEDVEKCTCFQCEIKEAQ